MDDPVFRLSTWRERIWDAIPYSIQDKFYSTRNFFVSRQRWLTKQIPRHWVDKDTILDIVVLECLRDYVEGEEGLKDHESSMADPDYPQHQKNFDAEVKYHYDLLTQTLPKLEKEMEELWKEYRKLRWNLEEISDRPSDECWAVSKKIEQLETEIYDIKTDIMIWTVNRRDCLWT